MTGLRLVMVLSTATGQRISAVQKADQDENSAVLLGRVDDARAMLKLYFGRQGRVVVLSTVDGSVRGRLETGWGDAGRLWFVMPDKARRNSEPAPRQGLNQLLETAR